MIRPLTRRTLLAALGAVAARTAFAVALSESDFSVHFDGDYLRVAAPRIDFLAGKELDRLKDGASVAFIGQIILTTSPNSLRPLARSVARFAFSYDIWEERFQVTKIGGSPDARRSVAHLSSASAQNWCLDNLAIDRSQIPADQPFYIEFDLRTEDPRDQLGIIGEPGINITRLIEIFARQPRTTQPHWGWNGGPFRLADLRRDRNPRG